MGHLAGSVATIPSAGYAWYVILLQDDWNDDNRRELDENFTTLAKLTGPGTLAVKGLQPPEFAEQMLQAFRLEPRPRFPAIIVTDTAPAAVQKDSVVRDTARTMVFSLNRRNERGQIADILSRIVEALRSEDAITALARADPTAVAERWAWLGMLELKPTFCGFGVNLNEVIRRVIDERAHG